MADTATDVPVVNIVDTEPHSELVGEPQTIYTSVEEAAVDSKANLFFQFGVHQEGAAEEEAAEKEAELQNGRDFQAIVRETHISSIECSILVHCQRVGAKVSRRNNDRELEGNQSFGAQ